MSLFPHSRDTMSRISNAVIGESSRPA
jgi:hypothetical protein